MLSWDDVREEFPVLNEITYINAASVGIIPESAISVANNWLNQRRYGNIHWLDWYESYKNAVRLFAKLINAREHEVTGVYNTTEGLNLIANSINWEKGGNIVINDLEFPTNVFIWQVIAKKHDLELRVIKNKDGYLELRDYEEVIDDKTNVVAVSWVEFSNGYVHNLEELARIAHDHDAYLIVDGIQGIGSLELDVSKTKIDFLSCGGHKWLMGFPGAGFMYIKEDFLNEIDPSFAGWLGDKEPSKFDFREYEPYPGARRFDLGSPNFIGYVVLEKTLELIHKIGIKNVQRHNIELAKKLIELVKDPIKVASPLINGEPMSPIISLKVPDAEKIYRKLRERKIYVALRRGNIRVSPHLYNNEADIELLAKSLNSISMF